MIHVVRVGISHFAYENLTESFFCSASNQKRQHGASEIFQHREFRYHCFGPLVRNAPVRIQPRFTRSSARRPQYWEIYKRKEVIGLSMTFMAVDISGGVFSILSLAFKEEFDVFASITYAVVIASHPSSVPHKNTGSYSIFQFTGHGYSYCDRCSHLESHGKAQTRRRDCGAHANGRSTDCFDEQFRTHKLPREIRSGTGCWASRG